MKINLKNVIENLILVLVSVIVGVGIGYKVSVKTAEKMIKAQEDVIVAAIDKETIKNEIKNEINIDKVKKSDSLVIKMIPENNQEPTNILNKENSVDCEVSAAEYNRLSDSRKKRLKKWIRE